MTVVLRRIAAIERVDARHRLLDQRLIGGQCFRRRIRQVGNERKVQIRITVGEKPDLQVLDQPVDRARVGEHRGYGDERPVLRRDATLEIEPGECMRPDDQRGGPGDQSDGQMQGDEHEWHCQYPNVPSRTRSREEGHHPDGGECHRRHQQKAECGPVQGGGAPRPRRKPGGHPCEPAAEFLQEMVSPGIDQPVADVRLPGGRVGRGRCIASQGDGPLRDLFLWPADPPSDRFNAGAVAIAGGEVCPGIDVGRVVDERLLDDAVTGDKIPPVMHGEKPQAADAIAYGHLICGLCLAFGQHHLLNLETLSRQAVFKPGGRQCKDGRVSLKGAGEVGEECAGERRGFPRHVRQHKYEIGRTLVRGLQQSVGPVGGYVAVVSGEGETLGHAAEIFDQGQP